MRLRVLSIVFCLYHRKGLYHLLTTVHVFDLHYSVSNQYELSKIHCVHVYKCVSVCAKLTIAVPVREYACPPTNPWALSNLSWNRWDARLYSFWSLLETFVNCLKNVYWDRKLKNWDGWKRRMELEALGMQCRWWECSLRLTGTVQVTREPDWRALRTRSNTLFGMASLSWKSILSATPPVSAMKASPGWPPYMLL
jgi:hypothetical protein